ncbi:unnamed protein product [Schistocephalus solidus]|uniref:Reverse transcriptase domain-containing protein n=1 Tax=Schistocephalus solidus TaxID=70667 RepID=A0A183SQ53_SCHSO|nr:unnamed protein product [Schistocephalus solidus]
MFMWPPLAGTQLSPVSPRSWVLPSGHTPGNHHDRRAKPGEGLRCCVRLQTRYVCSLPLPFPLSRPPCPPLSPPTFTLPPSHPSFLLFFTLTSSLLPRSPPFFPPHDGNSPTARVNCNHGINDRLISLHLPLHGDKLATIISTCAPPLKSSDEKRYKSYQDLNGFLTTVAKAVKLIVLGDVSNRVGTCVLGPHGLARFNDNDLLLLQTCAKHSLILTNTFFHLLMRQRLSNELINRLAKPPVANLDTSVKNRWCQLRDTVQSTALDALGRAQRQYQDWFDDNGAAINALLAEKNQLHTAYVNSPTAANKTVFYRICRLVQQRLREMENAEEIQGRAVYQLSNGKLPGSDAIPAKVYKHGGPQLMNRLTVLFQEMCHQGQVSQDFKDATIVHLYKKKEKRLLCNNQRGSSLLNITGNIFARTLLNRLNAHLEQGRLTESQCIFRRRRGTINMIFAARRLQKKCKEMQTHLYTTFEDLIW